MERMGPPEILRLEDLCIQDEPPFCAAACPLHVDARAMLAAMARGEFDKASGIFSKRVPLPTILSRICDAPCEPFCKRTECGGAIKIGALEKTLAREVDFKPAGAVMRRAGGKRVAVVGSGLSGLTAAHELVGRGHDPIVFEAAPVPGGTLRTYPEETLPAAVIDEEIARLGQIGVEFRPNTALGEDVSLEELVAEYDAVCLCTGAEAAPGDAQAGSAAPAGAPAAGEDTDATAASDAATSADDSAPPGDAPLSAAIDEVTLATDTDKVFRAGALYRRELGRYSPVSSILEGRRAAISIDRLLKGESLTANRDKEGPYPTRLYTDIEGIESTPPLPLLEGQEAYDRDTAIAEAVRCLQCECLECVKACEYLQHFKEYPGKCIRKVTKNIISVPGKSLRTFTLFINTCSLCGLCGVVCPNDLDMTVVNSQARRIMWQQGMMPPAIHDFAIQDMLSSDSEAYSFYRNQPGTDSSAYLFFPGCQPAASEPDKVAQTYRLLMQSLGGGVGIMTGCCGMPAGWAGREELHRATLDTISARWQEMGHPKVIVACPTCKQSFSEGLPDIPVVSLWEVLDDIALPPPASPPDEELTLALHDPCTARNDRETQDHARSLIEKLGYTVEELPYSRETTKCCGYGGLMNQVDRVVGGEVAVARVEESPSPYVTYCINCRDIFARKDKDCYHILDLLFGAREDREGAGRIPTLSSHRRNRRRLAEDLLRELWGETMPALEPYCYLKIDMSAQVEAKLDAEAILLEDVQRTIYQAEQTGKKLYCPDTGHHIAHFREALITFWVEYAPTDDGYELFNAYSHRMQIVEGRA